MSAMAAADSAVLLAAAVRAAILARAPRRTVAATAAAVAGEEGAEAERIYEALKARGVDALLDDRDARPGFKFKDSELMGFPFRVAIGGRGLRDGIAEVKVRTDEGPAQSVPLGEVVDHLVELVRTAREGLRP